MTKATRSPTTHQPRPALVQAPVRALDADGVVVSLLGTLAFMIASLVCWLSLDALRAAGREWWLWVSLTGWAIGILGGLYAGWRSARRRRERSAG